jgi:hypothetical protein
MTDDAHLDYENLDVYRLAIEFLRLSMQVTAALPRGESELRSQLKRAAMSNARTERSRAKLGRWPRWAGR